MEKLTLKDLFCTKNRKFRIPSYQRSYSWGEKQINQFLDDLENTTDRYYLGHFLFEAEVNDKNCLHIIDGQQRLTTCVIFFTCLLNELKKREIEASSEILDDIEDYYIRDLRKGTQKLLTVDYDNNFFYDEIIEFKTSFNTPESKSQELILKAKSIFCDKLKEINDTVKLLKWKEIVENSTITMFVVSNKIEAAQIFAFQNDRGKSLSKIEVIKSFFMLQIYLQSQDEDFANQNISYLEEQFKRIYQKIVTIKLNEDDVLNYYWRSMSVSNGFNSDEVVEHVKKTLLDPSKASNKIEWIKDFVSGLSQAFDTVYKTENSDNSYISDLRYLNNMAISYPFLIKAERLKVSERVYSRLLKLLENITFRTLLRGGRAAIEDRLNWHLLHSNSETELTQRIDNIINNIRTNGWWWYWNDQQMVANLGVDYFYNNRVDNYFLWKYELYISNDNHPRPHNVTLSDLIRKESIEHIAPQTPTDGKPIENGYGVYEDKDDPSCGISSGGWLHSIGNLMLISQSHNSSIGNKVFKTKLDSYGKDNLLNQQKEIISFVTDSQNPIWDKDAINKRRGKMLDAAKNIWSLDVI